MFLIHRGSCLVNAFLLLCAIIKVKMMSDYIQFIYMLWQPQISLVVAKSRHTGMGTNNNKRIVQLKQFYCYMAYSFICYTNISNEWEMCGQLYVSCVWIGLFAANWMLLSQMLQNKLD